MSSFSQPPPKYTLKPLFTTSPPNLLASAKHLCLDEFTRESVSSQISSQSSSEFASHCTLPVAFIAVLDSNDDDDDDDDDESYQTVIAYACLKQLFQPDRAPALQKTLVLHTLVVARALRKCGVGARVLHDVIGIARERYDMHYVTLSVADNVNRSRLLGFYSRHGFKVILDGEGVCNGKVGMTVSEDGIGNLTSLFNKRLQVLSSTNDSNDDNKNGEEEGEATKRGVKWMRKRLVYNYPPPNNSPLTITDFHTVLSQTLTFSPELNGKFNLSVVGGEFGCVFVKQIGPSCGVCALAMGVNLLAVMKEGLHDPDSEPYSGPDPDSCRVKLNEVYDGFNIVTVPNSCNDGDVKHVDSADLLHQAIASKLTSDGEFYTASTLSLLCTVFHSRTTTSYHCPNFLSREQFVGVIGRGGLVLVPYDKLGNRVGCAGGRNGHWMVVCGYLIQCDDDSGNDDEKDGGIDDGEVLYHDHDVTITRQHSQQPNARISSTSSSTSTVPQIKAEQTLYLYCQHSQSPTPFMESYDKIKESNAQLLVTSGKFECAVDLKDQVVVLERC